MTQAERPELRLRYAARSDVGLVRSGNEDSGYAGAHMLVVADGMGGHAAGELASSTAIATFAELDLEPPGNEALNSMANAMDQTHEELENLMKENPGFQGMGTTVTAISWEDDRVAIAHVGDSRAYLLRDDQLVQLTKDHTYVQALVDAGEITSDEAEVHPKRNLLLKALDGIHAVDPDLSIRKVKAGDRFLLCSDGLSGVVRDPEIAEILRSGDPTGAVMALVEKAIEGGAPDNVTCVVADLVDEEPEATIPAPIETEPEDLNNTLAIPVQRSGAVPVVVGAAGELRNRHRLPGISFPEDSEPDPEHPRDETGENSNSNQDTPTDVTASQAPKRRRLSRLVPILGTLAVVAVALFGFGLYVNSQYYVSEFEDRVAIYQGIPEGFGAGTFSSVIQTSETQVGQLPTYSQQRVRDNIHSDDGLEGARRIVNSLENQAKVCEDRPSTRGCPNAPTSSNNGQSTSSPSPRQSGEN
ncbi:MAG: PP2C family serine/threonine-protein phosphatase [Candidatus Nanopelagicales bacterium]